MIITYFGSQPVSLIFTPVDLDQQNTDIKKYVFFSSFLFDYRQLNKGIKSNELQDLEGYPGGHVGKNGIGYKHLYR